MYATTYCNCSPSISLCAIDIPLGDYFAPGKNSSLPVCLSVSIRRAATFLRCLRLYGPSLPGSIHDRAAAHTTIKICPVCVRPRAALRFLGPTLANISPTSLSLLLWFVHSFIPTLGHLNGRERSIEWAARRQGSQRAFPRSRGSSMFRCVTRRSRTDGHRRLWSKNDQSRSEVREEGATRSNCAWTARLTD